MVIGLTAGSVWSNDVASRRSTRRFANCGMNCSIGSSSWKQPSSKRRSAAQDVISFVFEKTRNMWSTRNGICASMSAHPMHVTSIKSLLTSTAEENPERIAINVPLHGSVRGPKVVAGGCDFHVFDDWPRALIASKAVEVLTQDFESLPRDGGKTSRHLSPPHHRRLEPGNREIHQRGHDGEDGDSGHHDVHLENLRAVLDEIAEPQIGRLKLADDDTYQRQPRIDLERGHQGRHAAGQHDLSQNLSLGGAERLRQLDLVGIDALETRVDHQDGDEHGNCKRHAVDRQAGAEP